MEQFNINKIKLLPNPKNPPQMGDMEVKMKSENRHGKQRYSHHNSIISLV